MAHNRVLHVQRGFRMSLAYAKQVMRDHCSITWVVEGETIRDTSNEERLAMRAEQENRIRVQEMRQEILESSEIHGLRFARPKTTKYRAPHEAYVALEAPLTLRVCRWPRKLAQAA